MALAIIIDISIHAPHEGERRCCPGAARTVDRFQSTLPTRGSDPNATRPASRQSGFQSTLPTRGSDYLSTDDPVLMPDFNPRSPRGGATYNQCDCKTSYAISIHAPHEGERRSCAWLEDVATTNFNPRSPRGGATCNINNLVSNIFYFNPRSPRGGATSAADFKFFDN